MKYLAKTIVDYVICQADDSNSNLMFIMPSFPSSLLVRLGKDLQEKYNRMKRRVAFRYGVAYRLGESWKNNGTVIDRNNLMILKENGWYNDGDNLTSLRNIVKAPDEDFLVVMLAGYEHIDDQASLRDFFHLDQNKIWDICLNHSFVLWISEALVGKVNPEDSQTDFDNISHFFEALIYSGLADILSISNYLEDIDFEGVMSSTDAYSLVLNELEYFKLPRMSGLIGRHAKKTPFQYINAALDFFNYSMFLEGTSRKKYIDKINNFEKENTEDLDIDAMGSATLTDLKDYISNRSQAAAGKLKTADFIYILEQVLNYKAKFRDEVQVGKSLKPKKLAGVPPEIFLRAIWLTLNELKKKEKASFALEVNYLKSISLKSLEFKHDFKPGTEDEEEVDDHYKAKVFLRTALGGIDQLIEDNVIFKFEDNMQNRNSIFCSSSLEPSEGADSVLSYPKANTSEPYLKFEVSLHYEDNKLFRREYIWSLPAVHPSRLLFSLVKWTWRKFIDSGNALPVFSVPYMAEIFKARDEEEVTRMLNTALNSDKCTMSNILSDPDYDTNDPLRWPVNELSVKYQAFIKDVMENGFFYAMNQSYDELRKQFTTTCELLLLESRNSVFGPLIMKSFMFLPNQETLQNGWMWHDYVQAAIVTPLHPSLLEMLKHQHAFLCESLCYYAVQLFSVTGTKVSGEKKWDRVADLARIQWPVFGTLKNVSKTLDTTVRSFGYTHLVGEMLDKASFVSARLLLDTENEDDDEISDTELYRETRTSTLIKQQLENYRTLYSFADDGLSLGAYCGREVQPIIAGVDAFLSELLKDRGDRTYALQLTLFSDSRDDSSVTSWINAWKDRWQVAELSNGKQHYKRCRISVAYRVVSKIDGFKQFQNILERINMDLIFLVDFIGSEGSTFTPLEQMSDQTVYRKFPVLEKATCMLTGGGKGLQRERIISNQRFKMGALHSEIMARLQTGNAISDPKQKYAVIRGYDYNPWAKLVDAAHQQSTWVICIDPAIDEQLLQKRVDQNGYKREVIGFGTGVGAHGENNYTISTEKFFMTDIKQKMSSQISDLLGSGSWTQDDCKQIAESLISEAFKIAGLSIVKATGPERYVRELVANSIVRKILKKDEKAFCDEIVSLDAYLHWFDNDEDGRRPDLLRIRAEIIDGCFHIDAQIIECKLAQESEGFLQKARQQIETGLQQLIPCFKPRSSSDPEGIKDRPDQRYWWMQLHRLIASKGESKHANYQEILTALEQLSEGCFKIKWQAAAVAFWSDSNSDYMVCTPEWSFSYEDEEMAISVAQAGKEFIRKVALENVAKDIFCSESSLVQEYLQCGGSNGKEHSIKTPDNREGYAELSNGITVELKSEETKNNEEEVKMIEATAIKDVPNRILLGSFTIGEKDIYWEYGHPDLPNRHLLIFGASGTGKTYAVQALLWELSKAGQNSLIVDYTSGFTTNQLEPFIVNQLKPKQHLIKQQPLAINPFRRQFDLIDDMQISENPASTAQRVSGVFAGVYQLGDQQKSALYRAVREGVIKEENRFNLNKLIVGLEYVQEEGGPNAGSAASAISKIQPFVDMNPFGEEEPESWDKIYSDPEARCHIIQLAGFVKDASRLITEFALFDLYWYYRTKGSKENTKIIVLDEIQNLDHQLGSPLGQFLTEGRKFGISLILATQTLSNLSKEEQDRLFQASHKLFFKPADTEVKFFAQLLATATGKKSEEWVQNLTSLKRGECYSLGHALNLANGNLEVNRTFRIKIKSLDNRI